MSDVAVNPADKAPPHDYRGAPTDQDVPCPLCDYNLRGAAEPRCPECGYRFEWRDLLDPERRRHPYLFEHHPNRNVWSFIRTVKGTLRPRTFWRRLHPGQPSNVRRLVVYWFVVNLLALALPLSMLGLDMARHALANRQSRAVYISGQFNEMFPLPPSPRFFGQYFSTMRGTLATAVVIAPFYTAWPWLTFLALNVFQISMLRARVNASHVLRCVVYTFDAVAVVSWTVLFLAGAIVATVVLFEENVYWSRITEEAVAWAVLIWIVVGFLLFLYRLSVAYRLYLQFHRPFLTVLASQIIVALATLTALLWVATWNHL
jgi:hypothetical protein